MKTAKPNNPMTRGVSWKTKPQDRFVLRFIKIYFSAPLSAVLAQRVPHIRPSVLTSSAAGLGISAGVAFGLGLAWVGGLLAAVAQVLDGVDGQVARLTGIAMHSSSLPIDSPFIRRCLQWARWSSSGYAGGGPPIPG